MTAREDIGWMHGHRMQYALGLLTDEDEQRFAQILETHPGLRDVLYLPGVPADYGANDSRTGDPRDPTIRDVDLAHIPDEVLARWPRARQRTPGLKRQILETHLERCDECRGALSVVGMGMPVVTEVPKPLPVASPPRVVPTDQAHPRFGLRPIILGWAWAALATAALLWVVWTPRSSPEAERVPFVVPRTTRDAGQTVQAGNGRVAVLLRIPPALAGEGRVRVSITSETDAIAFETAGSPLDLEETVVVTPIDQPGTYRVRYRGGQRFVDSWFRVERAATP